MNSVLRRNKLGLAMLAALLLLVDAEIARRAGQGVFQLTRASTGEAASSAIRVLPEAVLIPLQVMIGGLIVAAQVGLCWLVWRWAWKHKATRLAWILGLPDDDNWAGSFDKTLKDFKFQSTTTGTLVLRSFGIVLVVWSIVLLWNSVMRTEGVEPFSIRQIPFHLFLWALGSAIILSVCDVQLLDGQFSYCRLFGWRSFPLESITRVRHLLLPPGVYVKINSAGKCYRLIFNPTGPVELRLGPPPLSVVELLEEVCRRNTAVPETRP